MNLSIIVPVFNVAQYLPKCIDSILEQPFSDFELILVDDGSTDCSGEICDNYQKKDNRIIVIHKANGGLSSARNAGLDISTGNIISFIDSDDWVDTSFFSSNIDYFDRYENLDMVFVPYKSIEESKELIKLYDRERIIKGNNEIINFYFSKENNLSVWKCLYKRTLFDDIRFPVGKIYEDGYIATELAPLLSCIAISNKGCYCYRIRSGSICNSETNIDKLLLHLEVYKQLIDFCASHQMQFNIFAHYFVAMACHLINNKNIKCNDNQVQILYDYYRWLKNRIKFSYLIFSDISFKGKLQLSIIKLSNYRIGRLCC